MNTPVPVMDSWDQNSPYVISVVSDFFPSMELPLHQHSRSQLVYAEFGVMRVHTETGTWVVPPNWGVWVPPFISHWTEIGPKPLQMRSTYIDASLAQEKQECAVVNVSPLMREVILEFSNRDMDYGEDSTTAQLGNLLVALILESDNAPFELTIGVDKRLRAITEYLIANPADDRSLEDWSRQVGASSRTLARLFINETNLNFRMWRQQARLLKSIELLSAPDSVTNVAYQVGYSSPSAFVAAFKEFMGMTPSQYTARIKPQAS